MKDKNGSEIVKGDLIMITFDDMIDVNAIIVVFDSIDENNTLTYYPLDKYGLQVAKYKAGESQSGFYRTKDFIIFDLTEEQTLKREEEHLREVEKDFYDKILVRLT